MDNIALIATLEKVTKLVGTAHHWQLMLQTDRINRFI